MNKLILLVFIILAASCTKDNETLFVEYRVSGAYTSTEIAYKDDGSKLIKKTIDFNSPEDEWSYHTEYTRGEIVYLSAVYYDSLSSVDVQIFIDGKIFKQASSVNEPTKYVIVSGTIPY
ncbi:MAG: hypothetical protein K8S16_06685 [Bacteroidales bacterium]|nr:hypothetical protein [Bacteroidales bacterium]